MNKSCTASCRGVTLRVSVQTLIWLHLFVSHDTFKHFNKTNKYKMMIIIMLTNCVMLKSLSFSLTLHSRIYSIFHKNSKYFYKYLKCQISSLKLCVLPLQYYSITVLQYYSITVLQYYSTTVHGYFSVCVSSHVPLQSNCPPAGQPIMICHLTHTSSRPAPW